MWEHKNLPEPRGGDGRGEGRKPRGRGRGATKLFTTAVKDTEAMILKLDTRGWLEELRLCYARDFMPEPCDARRVGPPDAQAVRVAEQFTVEMIAK